MQEVKDLVKVVPLPEVITEQKSRSGYSRKIGFEGGQMPLQRRVPKFGFTNINRKEYQGINLDTLQAIVDSGKITDTVNLDILIAID